MHKQRITQEIEQQNMQLGYLVSHFGLTTLSNIFLHHVTPLLVLVVKLIGGATPCRDGCFPNTKMVRLGLQLQSIQST